MTPRQIEAHFAAARKRLRREHNDRMEQAQVIAAFQSTKPPRLKELLVDVDAKPLGPMTAEQMKAIFAFALPTPEDEHARQRDHRRSAR